MRPDLGICDRKTRSVPAFNQVRLRRHTFNKDRYSRRFKNLIKADLGNGFLTAEGFSDMGGLVDELPRYDTAPANKLAGQTKSAQLMNVEAQKGLRTLQDALTKQQGLNQLGQLNQSLGDQTRDLKVNLLGIKNSLENLRDASDGVLTPQERINQILRDNTRELADQSNGLIGQKNALDRQLENITMMRDVWNSLDKKGFSQEVLSSIETYLGLFEKSADDLKANSVELQKLIDLYPELYRQRSAADVRRESIQTAISQGDLRSRIESEYASAQYRAGGSLFDRSGILQAQANQRLNQLKLGQELEGMGYTPESSEYRQLMSLQQETDKMKLDQAFVDATPGLREFSAGLDQVITGTKSLNDLWQDLAKTFLQMLSQELVLKPLQKMLGELFSSLSGNGSSNSIGGGSDFLSSLLGGGGGGGGGGGSSGFLSALFGGGEAAASAGAESFIGDALSSAVAFAYQGGMVGDIPNFAKGGSLISKISHAMSKERAMSGGRNPRLIVANDDEMILNAEQTKYWNDLRANEIKPYYAGGSIKNPISAMTPAPASSGGGVIHITSNNVINLASSNDLGRSVKQLEREDRQRADQAVRYRG